MQAAALFISGRCQLLSSHTATTRDTARGRSADIVYREIATAASDQGPFSDLCFLSLQSLRIGYVCPRFEQWTR